MVRLLSDVSRRVPGRTDRNRDGENTAKEGISGAPSHGRTTRTQEDPQLAQDRLPDEGQPARERAEAARGLERRKHLRGYFGSAHRQAALRAARRAAVSHRRNPSRHRPEQNPERLDRKNKEHGGLLRAVRAGMGLPRPANR